MERVLPILSDLSIFGSKEEEFQDTVGAIIRCRSNCVCIYFYMIATPLKPVAVVRGVFVDIKGKI
jgi:hypothetical protein